jgi:hypothetical protein
MSKVAYDSFINWQHMKWQSLLLIFIIGALIGLVIIFDQDLANLVPETRSFASTFNSRESGISGLWQLTAKAGLPAITWQMPYRNLGQTSGMLVIVAPTDLPADFECKQILAWVAAGNDLVYLDDFTVKFTRRLLQDLAIDATQKERLTDSPLLPANLPDGKHGYFSHVQALVVSCDTRLVKKQKLTPIVADQYGIIVGAIDYGKGHVLIGSTPSFVANRRFAERSNWSNFQFLINWFRQSPGQIIFDERCHGFSNAKNVFAYIFHGPFAFFFAQLCLIALAAIVSYSQRFGALIKVRQDRKVRLTNFVEAQARMLVRARSNNLVFSIIRQQLRSRLARLTMLSAIDSDQAIVDRLPEAFDRQAVFALLNCPVNIDSEEQMSNEELLGKIADCDKITKVLAEEFNTAFWQKEGHQ